MNDYAALMAVKRHSWGERFSEAALAQKFRPFFESGQRIEVRFPGGVIKRGTVGMTTGWMPTFLLMLRRDSTGSSWVLSDDVELLDVVTKRGKTR